MSKTCGDMYEICTDPALGAVMIQTHVSFWTHVTITTVPMHWNTGANHSCNPVSTMYKITNLYNLFYILTIPLWNTNLLSHFWWSILYFTNYNLLRVFFIFFIKLLKFRIKINQTRFNT